MKIRVVPQLYYREYKWQGEEKSVFDTPESGFWEEHNFITLRHSAGNDPFCAIPVERRNILRLQFDDVLENPDGDLVLFNIEMAQQIKKFILDIDRSKELYINCAAGISRSGAVGYVLNDYFNHHLQFNAVDDYYFKQYNRQIQPNSLVRDLLYKVFFDGDD